MYINTDCCEHLANFIYRKPSKKCGCALNSARRNTAPLFKHSNQQTKTNQARCLVANTPRLLYKSDHCDRDPTNCVWQWRANAHVTHIQLYRVSSGVCDNMWYMGKGSMLDFVLHNEVFVSSNRRNNDKEHAENVFALKMWNLWLFNVYRC